MGVITNYTPATPKNRYADAVAELIAAGNGAAYEMIAATEKGDTKGAVPFIDTEVVAFQTAAREAGYTAVQDRAAREVREDGTTRVVFTLTTLRERKTGDAESAPEPKSK